MIELLLFQPEIPQNTGNIARTCAVTGAKLTLIPPLGFSLSQKQIKRAGLDYWEDVEIQIIDSLDSYLETAPPFYFFSTKGRCPYTEITFPKECVLIFGSESKGLPDRFHKNYADHFYTIPMKPGARSLNLSNAAAIVLYEALRQHNFFFPSLQA